MVDKVRINLFTKHTWASVQNLKEKKDDRMTWPNHEH